MVINALSFLSLPSDSIRSARDSSQVTPGGISLHPFQVLPLNQMPALTQAFEIKTGFPLVSTSANRSGEPASTDAKTVSDIFGENLDIIVDGGQTPEQKPSTLVDITKKPARIVREGAISTPEINTILQTRPLKRT